MGELWEAGCNGDIYTSLFGIKEKLVNKKYYIYGIDSFAKNTLMLLTHFGVSVVGFVVAKEDEGGCDLSYIGKKIISIEDFDNLEDNNKCIIDPFGKWSEQLKKIASYRKVLFERSILKGKNFVIYGAGESGRTLAKIFVSCGVKPKCFIDRNTDMVGKIIENISVISVKEIGLLDNNVIMCVAINNQDARMDVIRYLCSCGFKNIYYFNSLWFNRDLNTDTMPGFLPQCLEYIIRHMSDRKIYLFSHDLIRLRQCVMLLKTLGIDNIVPVSDSNESGDNYRKYDIVNIYNLVYMDLKKIVIWGMVGEEKRLRSILNNIGVKDICCLYEGSGPLLLNREYILDVHLGYNDSRGVVKLSNRLKNGKEIVIGILGGSTSDVDLYIEGSWVQHFMEIAEQKGIRLSCYVAATAGNSVAQEHIRLIRDLLLLRPDVVISYSGVNEMKFPLKSHRFAHYYQRLIFEQMVSRESNLDFFGMKAENRISMGEYFESLADWWIYNERLMHIECLEYNVKFYAFLQPFMATKKKLTRFDEEIKLHCVDEDIKCNESNAIELEKVANIMNGTKWFHDLRGLFDEVIDPVYFDTCHVLRDKNKMIAERIWNTIKIEEMIKNV